MNGNLMRLQNRGIEESLAALREKHSVYKIGNKHWRCYEKNASIDIEADAEGRLVVYASLGLAPKDVTAALNTCAFASYMRHFERRADVFRSVSPHGREAWGPGFEIRNTRWCDPSLINPEVLEQIVEDMAYEAADMQGIMSGLTSGVLELADAVKMVDGHWQFSQFIDELKQEHDLASEGIVDELINQEGFNLVVEDDPVEQVNRENPDLSELVPRERPAFLLDTQLPLKTTCAFEAVGVLRVKGRCYPVRLSWSIPKSADIVIALADSIDANPEEAALAVADRARRYADWAPLAIHPLYGRTVYHARLESWELTSKRLDSFVAQTSSFLERNGSELLEILGLNVGYAEDSPQVRLSHVDDADDGVRYDFARKAFLAGVTYSPNHDGTYSWLAGDKAFVVLYTDFHEDMLLVDVRTWVEVAGRVQAVRLEKLRRHLLRRFDQGRLAWRIDTTTGKPLDEAGYIHHLYGYRLSDVVESEDGLKDVLEHDEQEALRVAQILKGLAQGEISAWRAARMVDQIGV